MNYVPPYLIDALPSVILVANIHKLSKLSLAIYYKFSIYIEQKNVRLLPQF